MTGVLLPVMSATTGADTLLSSGLFARVVTLAASLVRRLEVAVTTVALAHRTLHVAVPVDFRATFETVPASEEHPVLGGLCGVVDALHRVTLAARVEERLCVRISGVVCHRLDRPFGWRDRSPSVSCSMHPRASQALAA